MGYNVYIPHFILMAFNLFGKKKDSKVEIKARAPSNPEGDVAVIPSQNEGILKTYIPGFLYKPPFGYPRPENLPLIRQTAKNPYVYSIVKTLCDEVASADWDICVKEGVEETPELKAKREEIINFFINPNGNRESFAQILRAVTKDILELDSGVIVKSFNQAGELVQIFARDGGSFLKNPDIYGYMGNRVDIIEPMDEELINSYGEEERIHHYDLYYKHQAAYFQYGWTSASMPIPFGKQEVVYMMQNPRTDSIYGLSPVAILSDILYTLIYGSQYNLDFYMNNNMPEGVMSLLGADQATLKATKDRFEGTFREKDENTGFFRRVAYRLPWVNREVTFTPFQLDPKTMQIIEQQQWFTKVVWMCFGVTAEEMGFTENSNRAVSESQHAIAQRKAARPIFKTIQYHINQELIPEFGTTDLEFKFVEYNLDEEMKKYDLYLKKQQLGVVTPEMIAEEEGLDVEKVRQAQEEKKAKEEAEMQMRQGFNNFQSDKKSILITEIPDEYEDEFEVGDKVKVINGSKDYLDKVGTILSIGEKGSIVVQFEVGKDVFGAKQLVLIDDEESVLSSIKAKDPFNMTELERKMVRDIDISGKKLRKALKKTLDKNEL